MGSLERIRSADILRRLFLRSISSARIPSTRFDALDLISGLVYDVIL